MKPVQRLKSNKMGWVVALRTMREEKITNVYPKQSQRVEVSKSPTFLKYLLSFSFWPRSWGVTADLKRLQGDNKLKYSWFG
jgi:hypothetical protein